MVQTAALTDLGEIRRTRAGHRVTITISQPRRKNALTPAMWQQLADEVRAADQDSTVRTIVIRGDGSDFSTGVDLAHTWASVGRVDPTELTDAAEQALRATRAVTVAVIDGHCVGGGLMIAAACHFRLSSTSATYAITPALLGVIYPASSVRRVAALAGLSVTRRMVVAGETLRAEEVRVAGLVDHVYPDAELDERADAYLTRIEALAPLSQVCANEFLDGRGVAGESELDASRRWEKMAREDPEQRRRVEAFLERKKL